jgi:ATP-dependent DNA helicase RecG
VPLQLSTPVKFVKRIGERIAAGLADRGVSTIEDLLYHLPFRYEDRLHPKPLSLYNPGDMASLIGEVRGTTLLRTRSGPIFEMTVGITPPDPNSEAAMQGLLAPPPSFAAAQIGYPEASASGLISTNKSGGALAPGPGPILETVKCMWFHGTYLKDKFHPGQSIALYGKLEGSRSGNALNASPGSARFKMIQPTFEILPDAHATGDDAEFTMLEMGRIVPVYESLGGKTPWGSKLTSRWHRRIMWTIFKDLSESEAISNSVILSEAHSAQPKQPSHNSVILSEAHSAQPKDPSHNSVILSEAHSAQPKDPSHNSVILSEAHSAQPKDLPARSQRQGSSSLPAYTPNPSATEANHAGDTLPTSLRTRLAFPTRMDALRDLHFPPAGTAMTELMSARTPAHRRLIFEEFFYLELGLELKRRKLRNRQGTAFVTNEKVREALKQILPFKPTAAQKRVLGEIVTDMRRPQPMRRLLQGDVGSGKTIVAFQAALVAIENGYQVALMAPTEILATQHYLSARKLLSEKISPRTQRPYRIGLLTGSIDDRTKRDTRGRIFRGEIDLAIGTHALVEEKVDFANLGLVIVDEQHRFGVQQRFQLMRKPNSGAPANFVLSDNQNSVILSEDEDAFNDSVILSEARSAQPKDPPHRPQQQAAQPLPASEPDVLVMTATPIPRTLALTLYGDLEASIIDELPPGRTPIQTRRMPEERSAEVWDFVRKQVTAGRQAYIVYPIIEGANDDQPELDFALDSEPAEGEGGFSPLSATSAKKGFSPGPSLRFDQRHEAESPTAAAPKARSHTSVGQRPTKAALKNPSRAEGPTHSASPKTSKTKRSATNLRSATEMHDELQQGPLAGLKLGLLHGRMSADDKEVTMARFKRGELDVLVATTVIEVGVDVPNSTVMVIEHADRFGLAQLHQLRGRVGRGAAKSYCILITAATITPEAELRLDAMVQTQDGFALAELDLQQRGPGEFFGTKQAGLPEFRVANLARDRDLLELARLEAAHFAEQLDPTIPRPEIEAVWSRLKQQWQRRYGLVEA